MWSSGFREGKGGHDKIYFTTRSKVDVISIMHCNENNVKHTDVADSWRHLSGMRQPSTLYSTEACISEFSIGECIMPNILKISLRILALWEDKSKFQKAC